MMKTFVETHLSLPNSFVNNYPPTPQKKGASPSTFPVPPRQQIILLKIFKILKVLLYNFCHFSKEYISYACVSVNPVPLSPQADPKYSI